MKLKYSGVLIILLISISFTSSNAQYSDSTFKQYFSRLSNQQIYFNDDTPMATISEVSNEYLIAKVSNSYSILIPFHSICKVETIGHGKSAVIKIFLFYHKENKN
jgi:hypothetical protein